MRRRSGSLRALVEQQAAEIARLDAERASLLASIQSRSDELDVAARMLAARARTMTSVIDAVTEQSIIGTDRDGVIRVWNPGAEKILGLPRADVRPAGHERRTSCAMVTSSARQPNQSASMSRIRVSLVACANNVSDE